MALTLHYLDFDYSEDDAGCGTWDAMASVRPAQLDALLDEMAQVLDWAGEEFAERQGPIEDGGDWDYDLQGVHEVSCLQHPHYEAALGRIVLAPADSDDNGAGRYIFTLSISGSPAFGAAWRAQFGSD